MSHSILKSQFELYKQYFLVNLSPKPTNTCVFPVPPVLVKINLDAERRTSVRGSPGRIKQPLASFLLPRVISTSWIGPALWHINWLQGVAGVLLVPGHWLCARLQDQVNWFYLKTGPEVARFIIFVNNMIIRWKVLIIFKSGQMFYGMI